MESGTRLGHYEILEQLGAGGMGEVYLAEDTRLSRKVAIKVLPAEFANDPERLARFEQEARASAALNHPHIAAVFDIGVEGEGEARTHFMVQEYLQGSTVRDALGNGALALDKALALGTEIAEALRAAHRAGIVHRDLKPDNIFITEDGHAKVLDFGLAKLMEVSTLSGSASMSPTMLGTVAGQVMGTAGYMAPEQVNGEEVDHRADLFAFGCVLYEAVTGRRAFAGASVVQTLSKIAHEEPEPVSEIVATSPAELHRIVRKCLAKDRAKRYQAAGDLVVDLQAIAAEIEAGTAVRGESGLAAPGVAAGGGLPPRLVAGLLAASVVITAVIAVFATDWLQPEPAPAPVRSFDFAFPETHPAQLPCCSTNFAFAPDASFLAFFAGGEGVALSESSGLFVRPFDSLETRRVGGAAGFAPSVSPDGEWIAYLAPGGGSVSLMKIALAGGAPFELAPRANVLAGLTWADDGYIYMGSPDAGTFVRISENGGELEQLAVTGLPDGVSAIRVSVIAEYSAALLDLGKAPSFDLEEHGIAVVDLDTMSASMLIDEGSDPRWTESGHVLWTRAGVVYAAPFDAASRQLTGPAVPVLQGVAVDFAGAAQMAVADDGTLAWVPGESAGTLESPARLEWLDTDGNSVPVAETERNYLTARLSPDETKAAVTVFDAAEGGSGTDVWILDIAQDSLTRLTAGGGSRPQWSPEGDWVYFDTQAGGDSDIWRRRSDFSAPAEAVLQREGNQWVDAIAPDGLSLVYQQETDASEGNERDDRDLWLQPLDGTDPTPLVESPDFERHAEFSPDGRLLAYVSNESGTDQVYVREMAGQRRWTVSPGGGFGPRWSRDGRQLFYGSGRLLFVVDVEFDGDYRQSRPRQLEVPEGLQTPGDIAADGRMLAIRREGLLGGQSAERARVNVTLNWFQELERLAPHGR